MNRKIIVVLVALLSAVIGNEGQTKPSWKIPLEGGYRYIVTVEYGGAFYKGGNDEYHTDTNNGYYALDFSITSDIANPKVVAPEAGTVTEILSNPSVGLGYGVKLDHGDGYTSETGHYADMPYVKVGDHINQGQPLGIMGSTGKSTGKHTHFRVLYNGKCHSAILESKPEPLSGYTGDSLKAGKIVMSDNYFSVGKYPDSTLSQPILTRYQQATNEGHPLGSPRDNGGGVYVHNWNGVVLQDFYGTSTGFYHGCTSIIVGPDGNSAYLLKEGFWDYYMNNNGPTTLGAPFTEEIASHYANSPFVQAGDYVQPNNKIVVQKFRQTGTEERRTLVFNKSTNAAATHFAVGEFSIGSDRSENNVQWYVTVDSDPTHDIPWPKAGIVTPTGKWFAKAIIGEQRYNFVRHNNNGSRMGGQGFTAAITEGNEQSAEPSGSPTSPPIIFPPPSNPPIINPPSNPVATNTFTPTNTPTNTPTLAIPGVIFFTDFETANPFVEEDHWDMSGGPYKTGSAELKVMDGAGMNNSRGLVLINNGARSNYNVQIKTIGNTHIVNGSKYEVGFDARVDNSGHTFVQFCREIGPWTSYGGNQYFILTQNWQKHSYQFVAVNNPEAEPALNRFTFMWGDCLGSLYLDNITVKEVKDVAPTATPTITSTPIPIATNPPAAPTLTPTPTVTPVAVQPYTFTNAWTGDGFTAGTEQWSLVPVNPRSEFETGEKVVGLFELRDLYKTFRYVWEIWRNGIKEYEQVESWKDVNGYWSHSYCLPTYKNAMPGDGEFKLFIDTGDGPKYVASVKFKVKSLAYTSLLMNGDFESVTGTAGWEFALDKAGAQAIRQVVQGYSGNGIVVDNQKQLAEEWGVQLRQIGTDINLGDRLLFSAKMKAENAPAPVYFAVGRNVSPYDSFGAYQSVKVNSTWQEYSFTFFVKSSSHPELGIKDVRVGLYFGQTQGKVWVDDVKLEKY